MTDQHTDDRKPFWTVAAIFDPDGMGHDFAYTIGLHERGVPELWMAGRPSLGDDPGLDWKFSAHDLCHVLNELSWDWLEDRLSVGEEFEQEYDAGFVTVRFRVDPPGDRDRLEAFQIAPGAEVVPIRWSLHRPPVGESRPMDAAAEAAAEQELVSVMAALPDTDHEPPGWELPEVMDWSIDGRYGPRTPLVLARASYLWAGSDSSLLDVHWVLMDMMEHRRLTAPLAVVRSVARAEGRVDHIDELEATVPALVDQVMVRLHRALVSTGNHIDDEERAGITRGMAQFALTALAAEVVADVIPDDVRMAAIGPLVAGRLPVGAAPGPEWLATEPVRDVVDSLVRDLRPAGALAVATVHVQQDSEEYLSIASKLRCLNYTTACCWEPADPAIGPAFWARIPDVRPTLGMAGRHAICEWACLVAAAVTHRMLLTSDDVDTFVAAYVASVPSLRGLLNRPL